MKQLPLPLLFGAVVLFTGCSRPSQTRQQAAQAVINSVTGNAQGSRDQARALRADSDKLLAAKDYNGAMDKRLEMLAVRGKDGSTFGSFASYAIQSLALADLATVASHLDATACRKYADQLAAIDAQMPSYAQMLQKQKAGELKSITTYTSKPKEWNDAIAKLGFTAQEQQTLYNTSTTQLKANITTLYDAEAKLSTQPYSAKPAPIPASIDPYTKMFARPTPLARFLWTKNKTQRILAVAALRQRADRLEKKKRAWPLPSDPFGASALKEKGSVIYSVGPDTKDDGGKPVPSPMRLSPVDVGDMLAPPF